MKKHILILCLVWAPFLILGACETEAEDFTDETFASLLSQVWATVDTHGVLIDDLDTAYDGIEPQRVPMTLYVDFEGEIRHAGHSCAWYPARNVTHDCTLYLIYEGTARHRDSDQHEAVFAVMTIEATAVMTQADLDFHSVTYVGPRVITEDYLLYINTEPPVATLDAAISRVFHTSLLKDEATDETLSEMGIALYELKQYPLEQVHRWLETD